MVFKNKISHKPKNNFGKMLKSYIANLQFKFRKIDKEVKNFIFKLLQKYVRISAQIDLDLISDLSGAVLPVDWASRPISPSTRVIGDRWVKEQSSAVLRLPSIVVPDEFNYLLNPVHPDFAKIEIGEPIAYFLTLD